SSRAGITCILQALNALKAAGRLDDTRLGVFAYADEGKGLLYSDKYLKQAATLAGRVFVLQPGFLGGKVINQRCGSRKYDILVEGPFHRIGSQECSADVLSWFLERAQGIGSLSRRQQKITVAVQEIHSDRYSVLLPHQVRATVFVTFLDTDLADEAEERLRKFFTPKQEEHGEIRVYFEKLEERPPFRYSPHNDLLIARLRKLSEEWELPFGVESSLLPSAAGEIPAGIPVICGFGPASRDMFTPFECVNRGELLQRALLLSLYLLEN
ncbi:MAG: D-alanine--D-alanine ligase, partial [Dethiobacteria bacterium]